MNENDSALPLAGGKQTSSRGDIPLWSSHSKPRPFADVDAIQSPVSTSALPPSPHRTLSGPPILLTSSIGSILAANDHSPTASSAVSNPSKSLRFSKEDEVLMKNKTTPASSAGPREGINRRHSADPKVNVYTKCGRNSDDWLFGGWKVTDTLKKIWEKEPKIEPPREKK